MNIIKCKANNMKCLSIILISIMLYGCKMNNKNTMKNNNPLLCNPEDGMCEIPTSKSTGDELKINNSKKKNLKVIYFTDPICSSCWGIEPELRKLKLEYGNDIEIEYRMGGLLPDWSYNGGGISKPSDVASHWDEVSVYYDMPIDGDLWLEDPLSSSYPPSIAFKAAQIQDDKKAVLFLREIREMVFIHKKNITKWEYIEQAAKKHDLDIIKLKNDYENKALTLFNEDLKLSKELGVRGFPTMFFVDTFGNREIVYGSKPYSIYENAILKLSSKCVKYNYDKTWESLFSIYQSLTAKEYSTLSGLPRSEAEKLLNELTAKGEVSRVNTKNGYIWTINL